MIAGVFGSIMLVGHVFEAENRDVGFRWSPAAQSNLSIGVFTLKMPGRPRF
jgi:hypothetical protein